MLAVRLIAISTLYDKDCAMNLLLHSQTMVPHSSILNRLIKMPDKVNLL